MDFKIILSLLLMGLVVFMGCTACDSENSNSIDLTRDEAILTNNLGWSAQQKYEIDEQILKQLNFSKSKYGSIMAEFVGEDEQIGSASFYLNKEGPVEFILELTNKSIKYSLKISATAESAPVLSLTEIGSNKKLYFSFGLLI
jgi:hypothetical protein